MAEETPQERRQDADETPPIVVPSHDPLPPPPDVSYTRPTPRATPPPALRPFGGDAPGRPPEEGRGAYVNKLGAGLAAATTFVASVVAGFLIGQWIDHRWGHAGGTPWGTLVFSLLGVAAGFLNLFRVLAATDRDKR